MLEVLIRFKASKECLKIRNLKRKMTGKQKYKNAVKKLKKDSVAEKAEVEKSKKEKELVRIERSKEVVVTSGGVSKVRGFEDLPASLIRIPYYRQVHPLSRGTELEDGTKAEAGSFLTDMQEEKETLRVAIIRAKTDKIRQTVKENGREVIKIKSVVRILAFDTVRYLPFQINVTKGSFSNVGDMMLWFNRKGAKSSYEYPVIIGSEFIETVDNPYFAMKFTCEDKKFSEKELEMITDVAMQYAGVLDKEVEEEPTKTDSSGNVVEDVPFPAGEGGEVVH